MSYETGGWPTAYEIIPGYDAAKNKLKDVAQRVGRLLAPMHAQIELSEHYVREHFVEAPEPAVAQPELPFEV